MIKLARTMQFRIVAEQVEHQEDFDWLRDIGVDFVQGISSTHPHCWVRSGGRQISEHRNP